MALSGLTFPCASSRGPGRGSRSGVTRGSATGRWAAAEAMALGRGGVARVAAATGMARNTIRAGLGDLRGPGQDAMTVRGVRRPGGGRKPLTHHDPMLLRSLEALMEPAALNGC